MVIGQLLGVEKVVAFLGSRQGEVVQVLRTEVRKLSVMLMGYVKTSKLTGEVLHVQTGRLRRSITAKTEEGGTLISGLVGTNVVYASAHEFGVDMFKVVTVRDYLRRTKASMKAAKKIGWRDGKGKNSARKVAARSEMLGAAVVHSFSRNQHIKLPERSFLRSSLNELGPDIRADLAAAVMKAMQP